MNSPKIALAVFLGFFGIAAAPLAAASLSVIVNPGLPTVPDAAYPGTNSSVTRTTDPQTGLTIALAGRSYGVDPTPGSQRWGLRAGSLVSNPSQGGFIVTNGFTPSAAGSRTDRNGNGASYVSITIANVQPGTVFQNISIDFDGVVFTRATNAWAAASEGGYANWSVARQTGNGNGRQISVALADFTFSGAAPLEFRVYGITGTDEGAFATMRLTASVSTAAVPEPTAFLFGLIALGWYLRRQR